MAGQDWDLEYEVDSPHGQQCSLRGSQVFLCQTLLTRTNHLVLMSKKKPWIWEWETVQRGNTPGGWSIWWRHRTSTLAHQTQATGLLKGSAAVTVIDLVRYATNVECPKVEKYLWRAQRKRQMPQTGSCTREGPSRRHVKSCPASATRRGKTARKRSSEGQVRAQRGGGTSGVQGGEGEGREESHASGGGAVPQRRQGQGNPATATVNHSA